MLDTSGYGLPSKLRELIDGLADEADFSLGEHTVATHLALLQELYRRQPGMLEAPGCVRLAAELFDFLIRDKPTALSVIAGNVLERLKSANRPVSGFERVVGFTDGFLEALAAGEELELHPVDYIALICELDSEEWTPDGVVELMNETFGQLPDSLMEVPPMNAPVALDDGVEVENFGLNIKTCVELLGHDLKWLAVRAEINEIILKGFTHGEGKLTDERVDAIANVLGLANDPSVLRYDPTDEDDRLDRMQLALTAAGLMDADDGSDEEGEDPPESDGYDDPSGAPEQQAAADAADAATAKEPSRADIARNIRAAVIKAERGLLETLAEAGIAEEKNKRFLTSYEGGSAEISDEGFAKLAKLTGVTVEQLKSGEGLEEFFPKPKVKGPKGSRAALTIDGLPQVTEAELIEFFRSKVLNRNVKPADGVEFGELMELALDPDSVDFKQAWLEKTADGQTFLDSVSKHVERLKPLGRVAKFYYLTILVERLFDD